MLIKMLLDTFFPAFCVGCGKEGKYICEKCYVFVGESSLICPACEESSFSGGTHQTCKEKYGLDGLANVWEYEGIAKKLLGLIKYGGITHAIGELVRTSFQLMAADNTRFGAFLEFLFGGLPIITYVPMFKAKEKRRGFNQAKLIVQAVGEMTGRKVLQLLTKIRDTSSQTELDKKEREENVKGSFAMLRAGGVLTVPMTTLSVVLVDDVWTTGATMKECCKVLKRAGAKEVWGFVLARTP